MIVLNNAILPRLVHCDYSHQRICKSSGRVWKTPFYVSSIKRWTKLLQMIFLGKEFEPWKVGVELKAPTAILLESAPMSMPSTGLEDLCVLNTPGFEWFPRLKRCLLDNGHEFQAQDSQF